MYAKSRPTGWAADCAAGRAACSAGRGLGRRPEYKRRRIGAAGRLTAFAFCLLACATTRAAAQDGSAATLPRMEADPSAGLLGAGFHELYELNFQGARAEFLAYQQRRPGDPLGKAAEAASYLYEQFQAKGVLTSAFFLDDAKLLGGVDGNAAENRNDGFLRANRLAHEMAEQELRSNPRDARGLLVLTLTDGMESDYDALIEKRQLASLSLIRRAEREGARLLAVDPSAQDAYVALGASNYILGCLPVYKRALLWMGGIRGDRARGIEQMQRAAEYGQYLRPFAKILLALAFEREHQPDRARALLAELAGEFPANPLFARELALLDARPAAKK